MRIGLLTDSLSNLTLPQALDTAADLGIETIELATGNWSSSPHIRLDELTADPAAITALRHEVASRGLDIEAFNASGNPLHPITGPEHGRVTRDTFRLAGELGVDKVVMMSGLPAAPGDTSPNWITTCWPPEVLDILEHQWEQVAIPYWLDLVEFAKSCGVTRLALELHPHQLVYNVRSFQRLRAAVGDVVGVNMDPSHLMWMGADPITAVNELGSAVYHVHAKDTRIETEAKVNSCYETHPFEQVEDRAWNYVTLGRGHTGGAEFWAAFIAALRNAGYDGALSIEHEDASQPRVDGVAESVEALRAALAAPAAEPAAQTVA